VIRAVFGGRRTGLAWTIVDPMMKIDGALASWAVVVWTGHGHSSAPTRDENRLVSEFGPELAANLVPLVRGLEDDFYRSDANLTAPDLGAMAAEASEEFRALHPELSDDAVAALAWCYTYDYK